MSATPRGSQSICNAGKESHQPKFFPLWNGFLPIEAPADEHDRATMQGQAEAIPCLRSLRCWSLAHLGVEPLE